MKPVKGLRNGDSFKFIQCFSRKTFPGKESKEWLLEGPLWTQQGVVSEQRLIEQALEMMTFRLFHNPCLGYRFEVK